MLTYSSPEKKPLPKSPEKPWLLLLLAFIWLWAGIIGRDLWGSEESHLYAYINSILETQNWLLPSIYEVPYLSNSPLYLWLGSISKFLFTSIGIPEYLSVRLLTLILMSASLLILGTAARNFLGRRYGRVAALIIIGCVGIILFGHNISQLPLLFFSLSLYSYALSQYKANKIFRTGLLIALSWMIAFYTQNLPPVLLLILISVCLTLHPGWRNRQYYLVLLVSIFIFLPLAALWPSALYVVYPFYFDTWLDLYSLGIYGGFAVPKFSLPTWYYFKNIIWYTFPAWPLAIWAIVKLKKNSYKNPIYFFFLLWSILGFLFLLFQSDPENNQLVLIIPPLAFLAASQIDTLKRGFSAFLNWLGIATFGLLALFIWGEYIAINFNLSSSLYERSAYFNPLYEPHVSILAMLVALIFTPIWLYAVNRKRIECRQAVTNWATGVTFIWLLMMSLFLSWLDTSKSARPLVAELEGIIPETTLSELNNLQVCANSDHLETLINWNEYSQYKIQSSINNPLSICQYHMLLGSGQEFTTKYPEVKNAWYAKRERKKNNVFILWNK
ncbi:hypothetical protein GKC56_07520 [Neisseriaceae bacterium PsAf]|nr:hypothetical protein [Neisseriaceae bacterium PsAf]